MKKSMNNRPLILAISLIVLAVVSRLLPHIPNFTPVAAIALFGGTVIQRKSLAFLIPMISLFISDLILGLHVTMIAVYGSMMFSVLLGFGLRKNMDWKRMAGFTLASSVIFFLLTNLAVWGTGMVGYPMNFSGLVECYVAALPFFRWEIIGNFVFVGLLFGVYHFAKNRISAIL